MINYAAKHITLDAEVLSAFGSAAGKYFASVGCAHSGAKAVHAFSSAVVRLISPFHSILLN
jgi:hypothetical protein